MSVIDFLSELDAVLPTPSETVKKKRKPVSLNLRHSATKVIHTSCTLQVESEYVNRQRFLDYCFCEEDEDGRRKKPRMERIISRPENPNDYFKRQLPLESPDELEATKKILKLHGIGDEKKA